MKRERKKIEIECPQCRLMFFKSASHHKHNLAKGLRSYCSTACSNASKRKYQELRCLVCTTSFVQRSSSQKFCSNSCAAVFNNKERGPRSADTKQRISTSVLTTLVNRVDSDKADKFISDNTHRSCSVCSRQFKPTSTGKKTCSASCGHVLRTGHPMYSESEVIQYLAQSEQALGRTPQRRELDVGYVTAAKRLFGSYNKALLACGIPPNSFKYQKNAVVCKDGHTCDSINESYVDEWLFTHNIPHTPHTKYPVDRKFMCDFFLPTKGIWLEFLGIYSNKQYDSHYEEKLLYLKEHGIHPICLYPSDLNKLDRSLSFLLC